MFQKDVNSKKITITAKELASMSQDKIYQVFTADNWKMLDESSRLAALQEIENRRAKIDGRPPIPILKGSKKEFKEPELFGGFDPADHVIRLNYRFLEGSSPMHTGVGALSTLLHEGRHAYQDHLVNQGVISESPDILKEWLTSTSIYIPPEVDALLYNMQSIEDDARRFARRELQGIINNLLLYGIADASYLNEFRNMLQWESQVIDAIQQFLTIKDLDEIEEMLISEMQNRYPDLDLKNLQLFETARLIINTKISSADDLIHLLDETDKIADAQLSKIRNQGPDRIHQKL